MAAPVLAHYDLSKPLILESDASPVGFRACLLQKWSDGSRIPVHFVSCSLSSAEFFYTRLSVKPLLSVLLSYLYGGKFIFRTDHKPLLHIFGENAEYLLLLFLVCNAGVLFLVLMNSPWSISKVVVIWLLIVFISFTLGAYC